MFSIALTIIFGYFFTQTAGYAVHKLLHNKKMGPLYESHRIHHWELYPPEDYLSAKYRAVPVKDRPWYYYAVVIAASIVGFYFLLPLHLVIILSAEMIVIAWANDWFHTQFHIEGHWLEKYKWFMKLRDLHYIHHLDVSLNLGIFSWYTDRALKSFDSQGPDEAVRD